MPNARIAHNCTLYCYLVHTHFTNIPDSPEAFQQLESSQTVLHLSSSVFFMSVQTEIPLFFTRHSPGMWLLTTKTCYDSHQRINSNIRSSQNDWRRVICQHRHWQSQRIKHSEQQYPQQLMEVTQVMRDASHHTSVVKNLPGVFFKQRPTTSYNLILISWEIISRDILETILNSWINL